MSLYKLSFLIHTDDSCKGAKVWDFRSSDFRDFCTAKPQWHLRDIRESVFIIGVNHTGDKKEENFEVFIFSYFVKGLLECTLLL